MDGDAWYPSTTQLQETSLEDGKAVQRLPREELVAYVNNTPPTLMGAGGEALPVIDGLARATRVPGIRVLGVKWDVLSSAVLTRCMRSLIGIEDMVFRERFDDSVQVVAWPDSVEYLEFGAYFDQEINGVQWPAFLQQPIFGSIFNQGLRGATWPSTLQLITVGDDFDSTGGITSSTESLALPGRRWRRFCPVCWSIF